MGLQAAKLLAWRLENDGGFEYQVLDAMQASSPLDSAYSAIEQPSPDCAENVVFVLSGFGDGIYQSYFGVDSRDLIVSLVTDFNIENRVVPDNDGLQILRRIGPKLLAEQREREEAKRADAARTGGDGEKE